MLYYYPVRSMIQKVVKREVLLNVASSQGRIQTSNSLTVSASSGQPSGHIATPEQQIDLLGFWEGEA